MTMRDVTSDFGGAIDKCVQDVSGKTIRTIPRNHGRFHECIFMRGKKNAFERGIFHI